MQRTNYHRKSGSHYLLNTIDITYFFEQCPWLTFSSKTAAKRSLPVTPVSPCDAPGFHLPYIPTGNLAHIGYCLYWNCRSYGKSFIDPWACLSCLHRSGDLHLYPNTRRGVSCGDQFERVLLTRIVVDQLFGLFVHVFSSSEGVMIFRPKCSKSIVSVPSSDQQRYSRPSREKWLADSKTKLRLWINDNMFLVARQNPRGAFWGVYQCFWLPAE